MGIKNVIGGSLYFAVLFSEAQLPLNLSMEKIPMIIIKALASLHIWYEYWLNRKFFNLV